MRFPIFILFSIFLAGCGGPGKETETGLASTTADPGRQMVEKYCSSCHLPVRPDVLNKKSWKDHVLPAMAEKMGIKVWNGNQYYPATGNAQAQISFDDWTKLVDYFDHAAPDSIPVLKSADSLRSDWFGFTAQVPLYRTAGVASTLMVSVDTFSNTIFTSDNDNDLFQWSTSLNKRKVFRLPSPAVNVHYLKSESGSTQNFLTLVGTMQAVDQSLGSLVSFNPALASNSTVTLADKFPRPVQSVPGDFNKDGLQDWIVCGFGHELGQLILVHQSPDHRFDKKVIRDVPGATQCITGDFNGDGWLDFYCLFAHADEGVWLFTNNKKGGFSSENILRFPPYYGSTSFQLVDFNEDGRLDILYTCGDNSDYSRILKPFHGVYIFLNEGGNRFKQSWFYHVNGTTKAVAADFNGDGLVDIATIAFFADLKNNPAEKFICFEQTGSKNFVAHALPIAGLGRWICMDVKDVDHDGDSDVILGNYSRGFINEDGFKPDWDVHTPFVVLVNGRR